LPEFDPAFALAAAFILLVAAAVCFGLAVLSLCFGSPAVDAAALMMTMLSFAPFVLLAPFAFFLFAAF
jgi:hypothetical protein